MTFKTTVKDLDGHPLADVIVMANELNTGKMFIRGTDGGGYADMAMLGATLGSDVMIIAMKDGYQILKSDFHKVTTQDQALELTLAPF